jgi:phage gp46-like protein
LPDIGTYQRANFPGFRVGLDWKLNDNGDLAGDDSDALATAVIIALGTDGLAAKEEVLPDPHSSDRMGWWGDLDAEEIWNGWPLGSRLWLLSRAKITDSLSLEGATVTRVENYLRESLQPFVDRRVATSFSMDVSRNAYNRNRIDAEVTIFRGQRPAVALQFQILWDRMTRVAVIPVW